jgi:hypothetical protein
MQPDERPRLRFLHERRNISEMKLENFRRLTSEDLKGSLAPGQVGSLKVRPDGTVLDGHHRLTILSERGEDLDELPREIINKD